MKKAKSALNGGFKAADWTLAAGSLTYVTMKTTKLWKGPKFSDRYPTYFR